jgi:SAM-dependent methyltransferase
MPDPDRHGRHRGDDGKITMNQKAQSDERTWQSLMMQWNHLGPPLRPSWEVLQILQQEIDAWSAANGGGPARALVFGVTPEFPNLRWPGGSRIHAVDKSMQMIRFIWYFTARHAGGAVNAMWEDLPIRRNCIDMILGDGCFTLVPWPHGYRRVLESMHAVLKEGGRVLIRCHTQPENPESPEEVFADLAAGRMPTFNAFKWRLLMSVHGLRADGVRLGDVWNAWHERGLGVDRLADEHGWHPATIRTMDFYRDSDIRYSFPREQEVRALCMRYFTELACRAPESEPGDRGRVLVLERPPGD